MGLKLSVQEARKLLGDSFTKEVRAQLNETSSNKSHKALVSTGKKKRKNDREGDEHIELLELFALRFPEYNEILIHIPNGGARKNKFEGWRLKKQGVKAGVSDLFLPVAKNGHHGLWIEFKAAPPFDSEVSPSQKKMAFTYEKTRL